jgi:DNA-binding response OmpR family regulator
VSRRALCLLARSRVRKLAQRGGHREETMDEGEPSILIVEDEEPIRALLVAILGADYECLSAEDVDRAVELAESHCFDLVLADVGLPGKSGFELCRVLAERVPQTVVILISGRIDNQFAVEALQAGAFDYVMKPFDIATIKSKIKLALRHRSDKTHSADKSNSATGDTP